MTTERTLPGPSSSAGAARFERHLVGIAAVFGILYSLQTLDGLLVGWASMAGPAGLVVVVLIAAALVVAAVPLVLPGSARRLLAAAVALYTCAECLWGFSLHGAPPEEPIVWLSALWPVQAMYLTTLVRRIWVPIAATVAAGAHIAAVLAAVGGSPSAILSSLVSMAAISGVLILLVGAVRRRYRRSERAQRNALTEYGRASYDAAAEAERIRTDALVHDSVLTTFLSAAAARTPEAEDLARRMAANALRVLAHVNREDRSGPAVPFGPAIRQGASGVPGLLDAFELRIGPAEDVVLPVAAAEAIVGAVLQAMTNSLQHAGPASRSVTAAPLGPDGVRVVVADDGAGFDPTIALEQRLGLRLSVVERMRRVDGRADLESEPGAGSRITLSWGSVVVTGTAPLAEDSAVTA